MIELAKHSLCTGCGACASVCAKRCITMQEDEIGQVYPVIDHSTCTKCNNCKKNCPILNPVISTKPHKAYAAWSNDAEERRTSASGGIAAELYKYALGKGYKVVGAAQDEDFSVHHKLTDKASDLHLFKNSKYVFSDAYAVFPQIKAALKQGDKVLFIGLPCQAAALKKLYPNSENLLLGELVCHGTTPYSYLKQHIDMLAKQYGKKPVKMSFRDPYTYTYTFTLSLSEREGEAFYANAAETMTDAYQFGYHRAVTYRDNCYNCTFAKPERVADFTIADYHGLGMLAPAPYDARNVSLILENSEKGTEFIECVIASSKIHADERPLDEPFKGEKQLREPSVKKNARIQFERDIAEQHGDFCKSIVKPWEIYKREERIRKVISFPRRIARFVKKSIKKHLNK